MTDYRTPENMLADEVVGEDELVPADDAIIGRAFRWSLLTFVVIGGVIAAMVLIMRQPETNVVAQPREFVPPRPLESAAVAPAISFADITGRAGIDFVHVNGATGDKLLPETMGGGAAFLDFDNDGDQDVLLVNSCAWNQTELPPEISGVQRAERSASAPTHGLFQNDGKGAFSNVSSGSGLDVTFYGMGVATGDYDNDGLVDVFISALGPNHLYRNLGGGKFEDVTASAGVAGQPDAWSTSAGFIDIDNDADLDLFVCNYVKWSRDIDFAVNYTLTGIGRAYGPPTNFAGTHCYVYRNNGPVTYGEPTFSDISQEAGIEVRAVLQQPMGKALGLVPFDVDSDGLIDLAIANDTVRRFFFHNLGNGKFEEIGRENGLAFDRHGNATGAMGIDAAHYRNDDALGVVIGNFANEMSSLMVSNASKRGQFVDEAITEGIGAPTRLKLKFGTFFFDADLDGRLDILHANGHIEDDIAKVQESQTYRQGAQLFWNAGPTAPACFVEAAPSALGDLPTPIVGRGATYADIDNDGDLDVLLTQVNGAAVLLRNDRVSENHWLRVKLVGNGRTVNRDAIGARIELVAEGVTQTRVVMPTRSYLSQVELPVTLGLGQATSVSALRVAWPDGSRSEHAAPEIDRFITIRQK
jgi:hypothetical protein